VVWWYSCRTCCFFCLVFFIRRFVKVCVCAPVLPCTFRTRNQSHETHWVARTRQLVPKQLRNRTNSLLVIAGWSTAEKSRLKKLFKRVHDVLDGLYNALYGFVLHSFRSMNRKIKSKFPVWRMKEETSEHVEQSVRVFSWLILPLSVVYVLGQHQFFGEYALGAMLWSIAVYFYSNFLPDIPSVYRKNSGTDSADLPWHKKYVLLLFAPLLIWLLFCGIRLSWRTADTFHNFRSLAVYGVFLSVVGFLGFARFPLSTGDLVNVLFFLFCGIAGFVAHLKVDGIW